MPIIKKMIESSFHAHEDEKYLTACKALGVEPIHNGDTAVWRVVISKDGHTLALGAMREITPSEYRIVQLEVLKEVRCQKLGKYALLYLETKARSIGGKMMSVEAPTDLVPYFRKLGYRYGDDGEVRENKVLLAKWLYKRYRT